MRVPRAQRKAEAAATQRGATMHPCKPAERVACSGCRARQHGSMPAARALQARRGSQSTQLARRTQKKGRVAYSSAAGEGQRGTRPVQTAAVSGIAPGGSPRVSFAFLKCGPSVLPPVFLALPAHRENRFERKQNHVLVAMPP